MKILTLKKAFESTFHNKFDFSDFLNLDIEREFEKFEVAKKVVLKPRNKLKRYHQFLNSFVFDHAKINKRVVHSYRRGKSVLSAVSKHADSKYYFKTDIHDFFNKITLPDIEYIFDNNLQESPIIDVRSYKEHILKLVSTGGGLPVGFSTSPNISNSCLSQFDMLIEDYCDRNGVIYTRYSDDLIMSSEEKSSLVNIDSVISNTLDNQFNGRLKLNTNKTKRTDKGKKVKLLGIVILPNGKVSVDVKFKKKVETLLHFYITDQEKFVDFLGNRYSGSLSSVTGQLLYINSIDKSYLKKLRKKYGNYVIDMFLNSK